MNSIRHSWTNVSVWVCMCFCSIHAACSSQTRFVCHINLIRFHCTFVFSLAFLIPILTYICQNACRSMQFLIRLHRLSEYRTLQSAILLFHHLVFVLSFMRSPYKLCLCVHVRVCAFTRFCLQSVDWSLLNGCLIGQYDTIFTYAYRAVSAYWLCAYHFACVHHADFAKCA